MSGFDLIFKNTLDDVFLCLWLTPRQTKRTTKRSLADFSESFLSRGLSRSHFLL